MPRGKVQTRILWIIPLYSVYKLKVKRELLCAFKQGRAGSSSRMFEICALEKEMLSVSAGSRGTTLVLPHSGRRERREVNSGKKLTCRETNPL